jgi:hypothetical protein
MPESQRFQGFSGLNLSFMSTPFGALPFAHSHKKQSKKYQLA